MNDKADATANILLMNPRVVLDRAGHELRAGRSIILDGSAHSTLVVALDTVSPAIFSIFQSMPRATLNLSSWRGSAIGLPPANPIAIRLAGLDFKAAMGLAEDSPGPVSNTRHLESDLAPELFDLCRRAFLRPVLLSARIGANTPVPQGIHRIAREALTMPLANVPAKFEIVSDANVPLAGNIHSRFVVLRSSAAPRDQVAIIVGGPDPSQPVPVWIHSACLTGDVFGALSHDRDDRLRSAAERLDAIGGGVLLYLDWSGRGIGIASNIRAHAYQNAGFDTLDANGGSGVEDRRHEQAAVILMRLGYRRISLLASNPVEIAALRQAGIEVVERQPSDIDRIDKIADGLSFKASRDRTAL